MVGKARQQHTLALLAEPFDDLSNDAGLACTGWAVDQEIIAHLQGAGHGQVLLVVKIGTRRDLLLREGRAQCAAHQATQTYISLEPAQQVLHSAHMYNAGTIAIHERRMRDTFRRPHAHLLRTHAEKCPGHHLAGYRVTIEVVTGTLLSVSSEQ